MANIKVNNLSALNISGAELFNDSESFMMELSDETEQMGVTGGLCPDSVTICVDADGLGGKGATCQATVKGCIGNTNLPIIAAVPQDMGGGGLA
jgi:hypothetical protein